MFPITGVTLKSCCLRCSASTCCPHLVSTVTGEDRRLGCGPVTHLVRGGPSSGLAGLGRTGLGGSSFPVPLGPGPAILHARSPSEDWAGPAPTGAARIHGLLPPTALSCACPSVPGVSPRFEMRARATDQRATAGGNPLAASGRFQRAHPVTVACRGVPAAAGPLPPVLIPAPTRSRPEDCQSGVSTPKAPSVPQHTLSVPQMRQRLV